MGICKRDKRQSRGRRRCCWKQEGELLRIREIYPGNRTIVRQRKVDKPSTRRARQNLPLGNLLNQEGCDYFVPLDYLCVLKQENYIAIYLLAERKQLASVLSDALK